jgi:hypothetical protein
VYMGAAWQPMSLEGYFVIDRATLPNMGTAG